MTLRAQLARIVGGERVCDAPALPETHPQDDSTPKPWLVVSPAASQQVQQVVRLCARQQVPLVPSSFGVHLRGDSPPVPRQPGNESEDCHLHHPGAVVEDASRTPQNIDRVLSPTPSSQCSLVTALH